MSKLFVLSIFLIMGNVFGAGKSEKLPLVWVPSGRYMWHGDKDKKEILYTVHPSDMGLCSHSLLGLCRSKSTIKDEPIEKLTKAVIKCTPTDESLLKDPIMKAMGLLAGIKECEKEYVENVKQLLNTYDPTKLISYYAVGCAATQFVGVWSNEAAVIMTSKLSLLARHPEVCCMLKRVEKGPEKKALRVLLLTEPKIAPVIASIIFEYEAEDDQALLEEQKDEIQQFSKIAQKLYEEQID